MDTERIDDIEAPERVNDEDLRAFLRDRTCPFCGRHRDDDPKPVVELVDVGGDGPVSTTFEFTCHSCGEEWVVQTDISAVTTVQKTK